MEAASTFSLLADKANRRFHHGFVCRSRHPWEQDCDCVDTRRVAGWASGQALDSHFEGALAKDKCEEVSS